MEDAASLVPRWIIVHTPAVQEQAITPRHTTETTVSTPVLLVVVELVEIQGPGDAAYS